MSGWDDAQARLFAKQIADRYKAAWFVLATDIREAVVSQHVLMIVLGQSREAVDVEDVRAMREAVCRHLLKRHGMKTETAEYLAAAEAPVS